MESLKNSFFIGNNRAMISLGPLNNKKYCPYSCAFCYVQGGFNKYIKLDIDGIIAFLKNNRKDYDIVYISGDTDSFAPPRTEKAIELIEKISDSINVDITFTTRTIFSNDSLIKLRNINELMKKNNRKLISSISISRLYSNEFIEPAPIPTPIERIETLKNLKKDRLIYYFSN